MKNYYRVLRLPACAPAAEIKKAYRKLALEHHPDRGGDADRMKEINEAYEFLVKNKAEYDKNFRPSRRINTEGFTINVGEYGWRFDFPASSTTGATWTSQA